MSDKQVESTTDKPQSDTKVILKPEQLRMANLLADPSETGTIVELCKKADVPRRTFYRWMEKKYFTDYVDSLIEVHTDAELGSVWKALSREAVKGNIHAIKLFFEMKQRYKHTAEVNHTFDNLTDEERENRLKELLEKAKSL
ncbi:phBC6A51 family helix-turn-helix protein [Metabacillus sp. cB07]|uniref:phBC6A51 family helix-turn-helix protein n=1 Tax=Metabacillus sp. cB07 TaxID=2806989 RepID=UPI001939F67E|nr:phBC6A51 family helix-turn-helix protein [Metabacillus sp. cB07]